MMDTSVPRCIPCSSSFATRVHWWCIAFVTRCHGRHGRISGDVLQVVCLKIGYGWLWPVVPHIVFGKLSMETILMNNYWWTTGWNLPMFRQAHVWNLGPASFPAGCLQGSWHTAEPPGGKFTDRYTIWSLSTSIVCSWICPQLETYPFLIALPSSILVQDPYSMRAINAIYLPVILTWQWTIRHLVRWFLPILIDLVEVFPASHVWLQKGMPQKIETVIHCKIFGYLWTIDSNPPRYQCPW